MAEMYDQQTGLITYAGMDQRAAAMQQDNINRSAIARNNGEALNPSQLIDAQGGARPRPGLWNRYSNWMSDPHNVNSFSAILGGMGSAIAPQGSWQQNLGGLASTLAANDEKRRYLMDRDAAMGAQLEAAFGQPFDIGGPSETTSKGTPKKSGESGSKKSAVQDVSVTQPTSARVSGSGPQDASVFWGDVRNNVGGNSPISPFFRNYLVGQSQPIDPYYSNPYLWQNPPAGQGWRR